MQRRNLSALLLLPALVLTMAPALAGEGHGDEKMAAWMAAMTPGEPHAELAEMAGEWSYVVTMWEDPAAEPIQVTGVSNKTLFMGGRFLREELSGEFMNRPFLGFGLTGYDNVTKQYVAIWLDNMGTGIHVYKGRENADGTKSYTCTLNDPVSGREIDTRSVSTVIDSDHHTFESYMKDDNGREQLHMRVEYSRVSG